MNDERQINTNITFLADCLSLLRINKVLAPTAIDDERFLYVSPTQHEE